AAVSIRHSPAGRARTARACLPQAARPGPMGPAPSRESVRNAGTSQPARRPSWPMSRPRSRLLNRFGDRREPGAEEEHMTSQTTAHKEELLRDSAWLRRLSHNLTHDGDEGDEVFHTSMVAAWERTDSSEGHKRLVHSPRSWLAGVVRNRAARGRREAARRTRRERRAARPEAQPSAADIVERREIQGRVAEAVLGLGEPYTSALLLRYWEDLKPRAIAAALSVPVETVRTRIKRGLGLLRSRLDGS